MASMVLKVLVLGHSFVKRLSWDISKGFNMQIGSSFGLVRTAVVWLAGMGGRTIDKLRHFDLDIITAYRSNIVILEIRTNDLSSVSCPCCQVLIVPK